MTKKVLIVTTSHSVLGATGYPTGLWLSELCEPRHVFVDAGYQVDVASLNGGAIPVDPTSDPRNPSHATHEDHSVNQAFLKEEKNLHQIAHSLKLADVNWADYDAIMFVGGNGTIFDFPKSATVANAIQYFLAAGKHVATVCHGTSALLEARLPNGKHVVDGLEISGFTNEEEAQAQAMVGKEFLPFMLQDEMAKRGAHYKHIHPWGCHVTSQLNGHLVTGQNNFSSKSVAQKVVEHLKAHHH